jgi:hypothetical protein
MAWAMGRDVAVDTVIRVNFRAKWDFPVNVANAGAVISSVKGPRQALSFLRDDFTIRSGQTYWTALAACGSAIRYDIDPDLARQLFVKAFAEYMCKRHH